MKVPKWRCYEPDCKNIYTLVELKTMWGSEIDQGNFADFESWLAEMEQYQILIRL